MSEAMCHNSRSELRGLASLGSESRGECEFMPRVRRERDARCSRSRMKADRRLCSAGKKPQSRGRSGGVGPMPKRTPEYSSTQVTGTTATAGRTAQGIQRTRRLPACSLPASHGRNTAPDSYILFTGQIRTALLSGRAGDSPLQRRPPAGSSGLLR